MKKRIFAALLCVIMLFGMLPITALAAEPTAHAVTIERTGEVYEDLVEAVKAAESETPSSSARATTHFTRFPAPDTPRGKI